MRKSKRQVFGCFLENGEGVRVSLGQGGTEMFGFAATRLARQASQEAFRFALDQTPDLPIDRPP
jgi:hypothetical protein